MTSMFVKYCGIHLFVGLSTDEKPTSAPNASRFYEMDTHKTWFFDKENIQWVETNNDEKGDKMVAIYYEQGDEFYYGYKDVNKTAFTSQQDAADFIGDNPIMLISIEDDGIVLFPTCTINVDGQFLVHATKEVSVTIDGENYNLVSPINIILYQSGSPK